MLIKFTVVIITICLNQDLSLVQREWQDLQSKDKHGKFSKYMKLSPLQLLE